MTQNQSLKTVIWLSSTKKELQNFPLPVRKTVGFALYQAQEGKKHIHAKPLKGFSGAGILEIVEDAYINIKQKNTNLFVS